MKRIAAAVTLAFCADQPSCRRSRGSYKDWPNTPIGYYLTNAERKQCGSRFRPMRKRSSSSKTFIAKRGGETFTREVCAERRKGRQVPDGRENAGYHETLRGKMMILPRTERGHGRLRKRKRAVKFTCAPATAIGPIFPVPTHCQDMQTRCPTIPATLTLFTTEYTYTYPAAALPTAYGKPLKVKIEVEPDKNRDRLSAIGAEKELDKLYEMVAQAKLAAAKRATQ